MKIAIVNYQTLDIINLENGKKNNLVDLLVEALSIDFDVLVDSINKLFLKNTKWDYSKIVNRAFKDNDIKMSHLIIDKYEREYEVMLKAVRNLLPHEQTEYLIADFVIFLQRVIGMWKDTYKQIISSNYLIHTSNVMLKSYMDEHNIPPIPPSLSMKSNVEFSFHTYDGNIYDAFAFDDYADFLAFSAGKVLQNKIPIKPCANCDKIFYPKKRSDEKYCDRVFQGSRTCKQVGYENKDEFTKAYRTAYKTNNAAKNRRIKSSPNAEKDFRKWVYGAKLKLEESRGGDMSIEEYREWLKQKK